MAGSRTTSLALSCLINARQYSRTQLCCLNKCSSRNGKTSSTHNFSSSSQCWAGSLPAEQFSSGFFKLDRKQTHPFGSIILARQDHQPSGMQPSHAYSSTVISKMTEDIDFDKLKDKQVPVVQVVKETVAARSEEALAALDEEGKKKLKVIQLEHSFMYSEGYNILSSEEMLSEHWVEALNLQSKQRRLKYYLHLFKKVQSKENEKKKKAERRESQMQTQSNRIDQYEHGRLFMRIYDSTVRKWQTSQLASAMQFGLPFVVDMDYCNFMRPQEIKNTAKQLIDVYSLNREDTKIPFHLVFTGCPDMNPAYRLMQMYLQNTPHIMMSVTEKSYMDVFDRNQLVYLSPNARQAMTEFDPNAVYIMGAFNDKAVQKPISYSRAKEQEIRSVRLPLDEHLRWNLGSKTLTLDQMMKIMIALKNGQPWSEALKAVPSRKLK